MPGKGEDDLDVMLDEPRAEPSLRAEEQDPDHAGDDRGYGEREIDEGQQELAAGKAEFRDGPGRRDAADRVDGHADKCRDERQPDRVQGDILADGGQEDFPAFPEGLGEKRRQGQEQEQREDDHREGNQQPPGPGWIFGGGTEHMAGSVWGCGVQRARQSRRRCRILMRRSRTKETTSMAAAMTAAAS